MAQAIPGVAQTQRRYCGKNQINSGYFGPDDVSGSDLAFLAADLRRRRLARNASFNLCSFSAAEGLLGDLPVSSDILYPRYA